MGYVEHKVQAIATFLKILELLILALQSLSPVSLKGVILEVTESKHAIFALEIRIKNCSRDFTTLDCSCTAAGLNISSHVWMHSIHFQTTQKIEMVTLSSLILYKYITDVFLGYEWKKSQKYDQSHQSSHQNLL